MCKIDDSLKATYGGNWIQQTWTGLFMLEVCLTKYKPSIIIELGTGYGTSARFFSMFAPVVTFDIDNTKLIKKYAGIAYYTKDVFSKNAQELIKKFIDTYSKIFLFCDGGNKGKEFNTYAPMLKSGDLLFGHDWKSDLHIGHITDLIVQLRPTPVSEQKQFNDLRTQLVGFVMK